MLTKMKLIHLAVVPICTLIHIGFTYPVAAFCIVVGIVLISAAALIVYYLASDLALALAATLLVGILAILAWCRHGPRTRTLLMDEKRKQKSIFANNFYEGENKKHNFAPRTIQRLCYSNGTWWTETESNSSGNERRRIRFRGINLPAKTPKSENPISFVDKPFPLNDAAEHFQRLSNYGYNLIRLGVTWEAVMHKGPGIIDQEYLA